MILAKASTATYSRQSFYSEFLTYTTVACQKAAKSNRGESRFRKKVPDMNLVKCLKNILSERLHLETMGNL